MRIFIASALVLLEIVGSGSVRAEILTGTIADAFYSQVGGFELRIGKPIDLRGAVIVIHAEDVPRLVKSPTINFGAGCSACIALLSAKPRDPLTEHLRKASNGAQFDLPDGEIRILLQSNRFNDLLTRFGTQTASASGSGGGQSPPEPPPPSPPKGAPDHTRDLRTEDGKCELEHICVEPGERKVCANLKCENLELEVCNSEIQLNVNVSVGPVDITVHGLPSQSASR